MADVDPIIAQNVIISEALDRDLVTDKIFLSPLAEKQWREDFSCEVQASKIFALYLSENNVDGVYVVSFINDNTTFSKDALQEDDCPYSGLIKYHGIACNRTVPEYAPSSININYYNNYSRTFYPSYNTVFLDVIYPNNDLNTLHYNLLAAFGVIAPVNTPNIPRKEPEGFFASVSDVVVNSRSAKIEEQEMLLNNQQKAFRQTEAALESARKIFNDLFEGSASGQLQSQIEALMKFPAIKSIEFTDTDLIVYTNMLDIGVTDKDYDGGAWENVTMPLGEFEIRFRLQEIMTGGFITSHVSFINLTEYEKGSPLTHPHITSPTNACLSQWEENFIQAGHNFSVIGLVSNAINYLKTFNPEDDYGENIFDFRGSDVFEGVCDRGNGREEGENGDHDRPGYGGEWEYYDHRVNGEFRDGGWEWYEDEVNGEYRNHDWVWYDNLDGEEGDWDGISFYWYEDNEDYIQVDGEWIDAASHNDYVWHGDNGEWVNAEDHEDYQLVDGEWINAAEDEDYYQVDDVWMHIDEIEELYASQYETTVEDEVTV